jgi:hypothetical protein
MTPELEGEPQVLPLTEGDPLLAANAIYSTELGYFSR